MPDAGTLNEEMNKFLRSHNILHVDHHVLNNDTGSYWCFCIRYLEGAASGAREREKVDYMKVLDQATFQRFSKMRELRKQLALDDGVPPFVVFTDEELAGVAKIPPPLSLAAMKKIPGIGEKKVGKYGAKFIELLQDAPS